MRFVLCELSPPVITAAAVPVSALARGAHAVAPAAPLVPEPRRFQSQENVEELLWCEKMENFELTGSGLNRLYSVQVQVQFNSIQYTIRLNLDLAKVNPSGSKLKSKTGISDQLKAQFKSVQLTIHFNVGLAKS